MTGRISDERFARMSATYEAEQQTLEKRVAELQILMDGARFCLHEQSGIMALSQ